MTFDERIILTVEDIPVPEELKPENIALMLKAKQGKKTEIKMSSADSAAKVPKSAPKITVSKRDVIFKITAAIAACTVLAAGLLIYGSGTREKPQLDEIIAYQDVQPPVSMTSYSELYNVYTALAIKSTETEEFSNGIKDDMWVPGSGTDIVKTDGESIFSLSDRQLRIIDPQTLLEISSVTSSFDPPLEMYIEGNTLYLLSAQGESGVCAEIFDISDRVRPVKISDINQCGTYVSSKTNGGKLIIVTDYSDYRNVPLQNDTDLKGFVPYYSVRGERFFVEADNIIVPANAASTDYTVISAVSVASDSVETEVKAILGSGGHAYCGGENLYIFGNEYLSGYSIVSQFGIQGDGNLAYGGSVSLAGLISGIPSVDESDGLLRVVTNSFDENKMVTTNVYVLDKMEVINSAGSLLSGKILTDVRFTENFVSLYTDNTEVPALTLDLDSSPPKAADYSAVMDGKVVKFSDNELLKYSVQTDENNNTVGLSIAMIDASSGAVITEKSVSEGKIIFTEIVSDPGAFFLDAERGIVGIPMYSFNEFGTQNRYYIYTYDSNGFTEAAVIEYTDIDDVNTFKRALILDDKFYISGGLRLVCVRIEDWKVIDSNHPVIN
jgi:uncharacterized secreted protein with C-terminal beta-propeller domain